MCGIFPDAGHLKNFSFAHCQVQAEDFGKVIIVFRLDKDTLIAVNCQYDTFTRYK